jgi:hypothetical protein
LSWSAREDLHSRAAPSSNVHEKCLSVLRFSYWRV